jgi:CheY-like chemotaxis protein
MTFTGKILLVDDEPHIRKIRRPARPGLGSPVIIEAANGEEALALPRESPDLVLLDVNMPGMDGLQILAAILAQDPEASSSCSRRSPTARRSRNASAGRGQATSARTRPRTPSSPSCRISSVQNLEPTESTCPTPSEARPAASAQSSQISEVRYSLAEMLREIEVERRESSFSMETLDQVEIQKMFANRRRRHARQEKKLSRSRPQGAGLRLRRRVE